MHFIKANNIKRNNGLTLIEIMIALLLGLIVIGGALSIYIATIRSSTDITNSARLNYDLDSVMQLMVNDIRRAGYWGGAVTGSDAQTNPFTIGAANIQIPVDSCILYTYDANGDGVVGTEHTEYYGFKLQDGRIQIRSSKAAETKTDCTGTGWETITDENKVNITSLTFSDNNSKCFNSTTKKLYAPAGEDKSCPATAVAGFSTAGDTLVETREIAITLTGNVVGDAPVTKSLTANVKVRNNRIFNQ
ncbi:MAG: prepilin-type N-terminal cleavage/methylation domain-containing protein [Methyloprofundus sp.]|nr:prepilin-type N-terminal cleavage/methylation domain-containing protein [Methyloprofundus sp.]MBW6454076.1 prepilin-type N-terminal cleavage/methylation domain-containing protein [Methyloprofundus sp.]